MCLITNTMARGLSCITADSVLLLLDSATSRETSTEHPTWHRKGARVYIRGRDSAGQGISGSSYRARKATGTKADGTLRLVDKFRRSIATNSPPHDHRVASTADQDTAHVHMAEEAFAITRKARPSWKTRSGESQQ